MIEIGTIFVVKKIIFIAFILHIKDIGSVFQDLINTLNLVNKGM